MKKLIGILAFMMISLALVSAGDFKINYGGNTIFTVATSGNMNVSGTIAENGVLLSDTYLALTGGSLTGVLSSDSNITTTAYFVGDGRYLTNLVIPEGSVTIAGENITSGTIDFARLPTLTNMITLDYHNVTGIPTCGAGEFLKFNGTTLSCVAESGADFTNVAYFNASQTWAEEQVFSKFINATKGVRLMSDSSVITRAGQEGTNISIDSSGNVIINLG